jgi:hypothetical protein
VQSNCSLQVEKPDPAVPSERLVTIKGTERAIQTAVYLIRQRLVQQDLRSQIGELLQLANEAKQSAPARETKAEARDREMADVNTRLQTIANNMTQAQTTAQEKEKEANRKQRRILHSSSATVNHIPQHSTDVVFVTALIAC